MHWQGALDVVSIFMGSLVMPKFFRDGLTTQSIGGHLGSIEVVGLPARLAEGEWELEAETCVGRVDAGLKVADAGAQGGPVIIYHHGASESPPDFGFNRILVAGREELNAGLILVRAPFHRSIGDFRKGIATLDGWMTMLAVSLCLIEEIIARLAEMERRPVTVSGTSLGGFVSNLHRIHFGTADAYIPIMAGTALDSVLLDSPYRRALPRLTEPEERGIREALNFEDDFAAIDADNVHPLLARFDEIVKYPRQKDSYASCPVSEFPKSHVTGALAGPAVRRHIARYMAR